MPHISTYGTATTKVTPDIMNWQLSVTNKGVALESVASKHSELVGKVLGLLKENGIIDNDVQTSRMEFNENWEYKNNSRVKEGYYSSTDISFKLKDFNKYKDLWMSLAKISEVSVNGVYYDYSGRIEVQNETRQKALLAARDKAKALAETLGSTIGEPLLIEELFSYQDDVNKSRFSNVVNGYASESDVDNIVAPGQIPIRMQVKTSFRLITP